MVETRRPTILWNVSLILILTELSLRVS